MAIPKGYRQNFQTLLRAARSDDLALVECEDKQTRKKVYAVCAMGRDGEQFVISPFAKLFDGNPYDELNPPDPDKAEGFCRDEKPKKKEGKQMFCPSCGGKLVKDGKVRQEQMPGGVGHSYQPYGCSNCKGRWVYEYDPFAQEGVLRKAAEGGAG